MTSEDLPRLPFPRPGVLHFAPLLRTLQASTPVTPVRTPAGDVAWLVTGYAEVKALFADPRLGRSHPDPDNAARISHSAILGGPSGNAATEVADHALMRRLLTPAFSARRMQALWAHVTDLVETLLDQLAERHPAAAHPPRPARRSAARSCAGRGAVEEILRVAAPGGGGLPRYAQADIDIAGVTIRPGDAVLLTGIVANRDPAAFPDPDRFDVTRSPNPHLSFGHGPRFCIGASLARVELQTVFTALPHRFPTLELAVPLDQLRLRGDLVIGGLIALPVTW